MTDELYHYGIMGMKWGIRRYQNANGTLTSAGKKRYKAEYKADNKKAFELGRNASILDKSLSISNKKLEKARGTQREQLEEVTNKALRSQRDSAVKAMNEHHAKLIEKYGKDAVSDIKYNKLGEVNERTVSGGQMAAHAALSILGSAVLMPVAGLAVGVAPGGRTGAARQHYDVTKYATAKSLYPKGR